MKLENINYRYDFKSLLYKEDNLTLALAKYSEIDKGDNPCLFLGDISSPYIVSRCLVTLSNVVQSSFNLSPAEINLLKDPIVTTGNSKVRFEGFSHCAGLYARVDVLEEQGEFIENGTTNVDFNQEMISMLGGIKRSGEGMKLSVGKKEVQITTESKNVRERKVPLPNKWIKGLTTVQHYLSQTQEHFELNKLQTLQLFRSIPKGSIKTDYYLFKRGNKYIFSPLKSKDALVIGGIHRLQLLTPLLPLIDKCKIFAHENMQSVTIQLYFDEVVFSLSLSRSHWRGFSGEGTMLEELLEEVPESLIKKMDNYGFANQSFKSTLLALENDIELQKIEQLTSKLAAMGLLGYELDEKQFFYRRLPFKLSRILTLNPRLKGVEKLLENNQVNITFNNGTRVEAKVEGSGVEHLVVLEEKKARCTCIWFSQNQGERGDCKHVLALKKLLG